MPSLFDAVPQKVADAAKKASAFLTEHGIPHAIIGGLAISAHATPRNTNDVDFITTHAARDVVERLGENIKTLELYKNGDSRSTDPIEGVTVQLDGVDIDMLFMPEGITERDIKSSVKIEGVPVVSVEVLTLLKLWGGRVRDISDVNSLLTAGKLDRDRMRKFLKLVDKNTLEAWDSACLMADIETSRATNPRKPRPKQEQSTTAMIMAQVLSNMNTSIKIEALCQTEEGKACVVRALEVLAKHADEKRAPSIARTASSLRHAKLWSNGLMLTAAKHIRRAGKPQELF